LPAFDERLGDWLSQVLRAASTSFLSLFPLCQTQPLVFRTARRVSGHS